MRQAIRKHLPDFLAIMGVVVLGLAVGAYVLANQRLRFPMLEQKPFTVRAEPCRSKGIAIASMNPGKALWEMVTVEPGRSTLRTRPVVE